MGFPELPIVAKPDDVAFEKGNAWKAHALHQLLPEAAPSPCHAQPCNCL